MADRDDSLSHVTDDYADSVEPVDVTVELRDSFLEYAYSVIVSRALPDARDGLKPVHRRIVFQMHRMGLTPQKPYVKSARVVGDVMGKLHPHGDSAIYDAMVRLAQPWEMGACLVDGHGNFGSADDGPAASRYTEARLAAAALDLVSGIDEDTVDMRPNYDEREVEPVVLPAAYPNLLVNGSAGIAVGMATNIPTHNLGEAVAAARLLLARPDATLEDVMAVMPGPDFPTGGAIVGDAGIRDAYTTGRGQLRIRATATITDVSARRKGIEVTELPYGVGPEKIIAAIKSQQDAKRLQGVSRVVDLTDRKHGLRLVIEVKAGANPAAVLAELYQRTPLEDTFNVNAVALVDGAPRTLGVLDMLRVYVAHRKEVIRRRCEHRRRKALERAHIVEGLLVALGGIDEVVRILRSSKDTEQARSRLRRTFKLSEVQVNHILEMPLRRLVSLEVDRLRAELAELQAAIAELTAILADPARIAGVVSDELAEVSSRYPGGRRTVLLDAAEAARAADVGPAEVPDVECTVLLGTTGLLGRTPAPGDHAQGTGRRRTARTKLDAIAGSCRARTRGQAGLLTSAGRVHRVSALDVPALPPSASTLKGSPRLAEIVSLDPGEEPVALVSLDAAVWMATRDGLVKRTPADGWTTRAEAFEVIGLRDGDRVVAGGTVPDGDAGTWVLVSDDAQLLRFDLAAVAPKGRTAGGMAGIKLAAGAKVIAGALLATAGGAQVVTVAATPDGTPAGVKVTALDAYPGKGRGTGGVRCMRMLRGEERLGLAAVVTDPVAATAAGDPVDLPDPTDRRDGTGVPTARPVAAVGRQAAALTG